MGAHLAHILGLILIFSSLPLLFKYNTTNLNIFIMVSLISVLIYFVPTLTTLMNHAKQSTGISAFHKDKNTEYALIFGKILQSWQKYLKKK